MKKVFEYKGNIVIITKGKTTNEKISEGNSKIVQTYTFSKAQFAQANKGEKITMTEFFTDDETNCGDCKFSGNMRSKGLGLKTKCYTHKIMQYSGFLSSLRTVKVIEQYTEQLHNEIVEMCKDVYVRFGSYGEPSALPIQLVSDMVSTSKSHTGYTHQWSKPWAAKFNQFFMASAHNDEDAKQASVLGFRSFIAISKGQNATGIQCPASEEGGFKSNCERCGLCSGVRKGKRDVVIIEH